MEKCYYCDTELEKDDVALCKKLLGKKIKQYFCREHLAEVLDTDVDTLDLSAVTEVRVSDKGGVELKLVDRVRALESLCALLETGGGTDAQALYQALAEGGEEAGWDHE